MRRYGVAAVALAGLLFGQSGTSVIAGTVRDPSGAPAASAAVLLVNEGTGVGVSGQANQEGIYRIPSLPPGEYRLEVDAPGFEHLVRRRVSLQVSQTLAIDVTLQVGSHSDTVTVEAAAPLTDTQSSSLGQVVGRKQVAGLPLPNRAATSLVALSPGVVMIDAGAGTAENYPVFSVAGGRARNQNFTLDGGNVSNAVGLTRPQQLTSLPVDAMQEFRVISNNYAAEYGHSTGGVITLSTRSGTNDYHGSLFEFARNDALDARNFFASSKPPLRLHQFGASLGGPIQRDKTHFFLAWEQTRQVTGATVVQTVPDAFQRAGDFSRLRDAAGVPVPIYDPATTSGRNRSPFPGNVIPADRFDPVALAALSYWPLPNRAGTAAGANNFVGNSASTLDRDIVVGRLDHQPRPGDQLSARYYINNSGTFTRGSYGNPLADPDGDTTGVRIQSILGSHTHVFRPDLINELRIGYLRRKFIDQRPGAGLNLAGAIGLSGVSAAAFPTFTLPGYATLGGNPSRIQSPIEDTQIQDAVSYYRGKHAWKIGFEHRSGFNQERRDRSSSGAFAFTPLITGKPGTAGTGDAFASFLLGQVNSANVLASDLIPSEAAYWAGFVQDDWRMTPRLTLNGGLRWEAEIPRHVRHDRMNSFDPYALNPVSGTPGVVTFAGVNGVPRQAFDTQWKNFGPRLGFAYSAPFGRSLVIRGGAGIFYGPTISNSVGDAAAAGFSTSASLVAAQADIASVLRLRDGFPAIATQALSAGYGAVPAREVPNTSVSFFERNRPTPVSYQYNFNVQQEPVRDLLVEVGYLANVGHHLTANDLSLNQVPAALLGPGNAQLRRPFPQFSDVLSINPAVGNSTYHAGYVKAEKRFSRGFSFLAHYTYSKFIDDVAAANDYGDPGSYMDAYNRRLDKALSGSDVPHRTVLSGLYEAPAARGGWSVGLLVTLQSGAPFTVVTAANTTNAFSAGPLRPDLVGDPHLPDGQQTVSRWFNTAAFAAPALYRFGNSPRSVLRAAPVQTVDATLAKDFKIRERFHAGLRAEFYNLLNHANFDIPGHVLGTAGLGVVSSARPGRAAQLGARVSF